MAGRKRKRSFAEAEPAVNHMSQRDVKVSHAQLKSVHSENVPSETGQRHYFQRDGRLGENFFNQSCICLAKALLGRVLVRRCADGSELRGKIVETESYLGGEDKASHSAGGKRTERNTAMFMKPGTIYVYSIYGVYLCMNVSSQGDGAAVLLRSLEPLQGQHLMREFRAARRKEGAQPLKDKELCNGPAKLCQALDIPRCFDRRDLASDPEVWLEDDPQASPPEPHEVVSASRIGIESHGQWATKPLRFYLHGNPCVSVRNKEAERRTVAGAVMNESSHVKSETGQHSV